MNAGSTEPLARALREVAVALGQVAGRLHGLAATLDGGEPSDGTALRSPATAGDRVIGLSDDEAERDARILAEELVGW